MAKCNVRRNRGAKAFSKRGFTLIELMIVIAIIAIIAAIAIPNLLQSRIKANEATAITCVRNYGTAQVTFQLGHQASVITNATATHSGYRGYADNFRNLFYGNPRTTPVAGTGGVYLADTGRNLALISQAMADAYIFTAPLLTTTNKTPIAGPDSADGAIPYQGYHFAEDPHLANYPANAFVSNYALVAVPAHSANSGHSAFWMDSENSVLRMGLPSTFTTPDDSYDHVDGLTPLTSSSNRSGWSVL